MVERGTWATRLRGRDESLRGRDEKLRGRDDITQKPKWRWEAKNSGIGCDPTMGIFTEKMRKKLETLPC